jgi:hypothetical protein
VSDGVNHDGGGCGGATVDRVVPSSHREGVVTNSDDVHGLLDGQERNHLVHRFRKFC